MDGKNLTAWQFNGLETLWKTPVMGNPVGLVLSEDASKAALIFPKIGTAPYVRIFDATSGTERAKVALSGDVNSPFLAGCAFWKNRYVLLGFKGSGHYPLLVVDAEKGEECTAKYLSGEGEEIGSADDLQFSPDARSALFLEPSGFGLWRVDGVQAPGILLTDETNISALRSYFGEALFLPTANE